MELTTDITPASSKIGGLCVGPFVATTTGLKVVGGTVPDIELWLKYGAGLQQVCDSIHFLLGDWLNYGERHYGELYTQSLTVFNYTPSTLRVDSWVCRKIPQDRRAASLSFGHHRIVAALSDREQDYWLAMAAQGNQGDPWTVAELQQHIAAYQANSNQPGQGANASADAQAAASADALVASDVAHGIIADGLTGDPTDGQADSPAPANNTQPAGAILAGPGQSPAGLAALPKYTVTDVAFIITCQVTCPVGQVPAHHARYALEGLCMRRDGGISVEITNLKDSGEIVTGT